jgi:hypothetical protein
MLPQICPREWAYEPEPSLAILCGQMGEMGFADWGDFAERCSLREAGETVGKTISCESASIGRSHFGHDADPDEHSRGVRWLFHQKASRGRYVKPEP